MNGRISDSLFYAIVAGTFALGSAGLLAGCEDDGVFEEAGESVDDAADEVEDAADEVEDEL